MEAFNLDKVLEALVVETMRDQPEDPFAFMSEQMFKMAESFDQLRASMPEDGAAPKPDGWWTQWTGPDVSLSALGQSVTEQSNTPRDRWDQHYSVRSERFRYIRTNSGQEELYDCESDPHCWKNIADNPEYEAIKKSLHAQMKEMVGKPAAFDVRKAWSKPNP